MLKDMLFDMNKFKNLIHYIIFKCQDNPNFGKTVLYELSYFSDFNYYELYETLITGEIYHKFENGPVPKDFEEAIHELKSENKIEEHITSLYTYKQYRYTSKKEPDYSLFSANERKCIDETISKLENMDGCELINYTHGDMPWRATKQNAEIEPEFVFYRDSEYSVGVYDDEEY